MSYRLVGQIGHSDGFVVVADRVMHMALWGRTTQFTGKWMFACRIFAAPQLARGLLSDRRMDGTPMNLHELVALMRAEFNEMPGMRLTLSQAQRLWGVDAALCSSAVQALVRASFLRRAGGDFYVRAA